MHHLVVAGPGTHWQSTNHSGATDAWLAIRYPGGIQLHSFVLILHSSTKSTVKCEAWRGVAASPGAFLHSFDCVMAMWTPARTLQFYLVDTMHLLAVCTFTACAESLPHLYRNGLSRDTWNECKHDQNRRIERRLWCPHPRAHRSTCTQQDPAHASMDSRY